MTPPSKFISHPQIASEFVHMERLPDDASDSHLTQFPESATAPETCALIHSFLNSLVSGKSLPWARRKRAE
ncbi:hypothetical protein H0H93_006449 [Arthromyces matolae]|nr:hypothetical protein H0H93_006449 [Arthromyces matolae]